MGRHLPIALAAIGGIFLVLLFFLWGWSNRPYIPSQPVPFSHATHTSPEKAGMACEACHPYAHTAARAGMPSSSTCLDCHRHILADDTRLLPLHAAANPDHPVYTGEPVMWVSKNTLPGYAYFNHSVHMAKGYSCARCHEDPDRMPPHTMRNCLECHRAEAVPTDCTACHH